MLTKFKINKPTQNIKNKSTCHDQAAIYRSPVERETPQIVTLHKRSYLLNYLNSGGLAPAVVKVPLPHTHDSKEIFDYQDKIRQDHHLEWFVKGKSRGYLSLCS